MRLERIGISVLALSIAVVASSKVTRDSLLRTTENGISAGMLDGFPLDPRARAIMGGYHTFLASLGWTSGLLELADPIISGTTGARLSRLVETISIIDPEWTEPFYMGLAIEDANGRPTLETIRTFRLAIRLHPDVWRLRVLGAISILRYGEMGIQERIDSSSAWLAPLETSRDSTMPAHLRNLSTTLRSRQSDGMADLMLEVYGSQVRNSDRNRTELARLLVSSTPSVGFAEAERFLLMLDQLDPADKERIASLHFFRSPDRTWLMQQWEKRVGSKSGGT